MSKKINIKSLIICIIIPLAVGGLSALLTMGSMQDFEALNQPPLSPPGWLFPVVWTILYILMGVGSYLAVKASKEQGKDISKVLIPYAVQLILNLLWTPVFFGLSQFFLGSIICVILVFAIIWMIFSYYRVSPLAAYLQIPYLIWSVFASYLSIAIYLLN